MMLDVCTEDHKFESSHAYGHRCQTQEKLAGLAGQQKMPMRLRLSVALEWH